MTAVRQAHFEPHIQGLRALAVVSVVLYHLWPSRLTGGFVGVDVFFVISGYLICGHLVRELDATGSIRLIRFWSRRARRLLPAAFTVLLCSTVFVVIAMPAVEWAQNLDEIRAAALYAENWQLVASSIDYLGADNAPSLIQHFWSLSVEEQFYFLQPLVLLAAAACFRSRRVVVPVLLAVVALSLPYSVFLTAVQPGGAYFSTGTRAWEFAIGGLAAVFGRSIPFGPRVQAVLGWLGLGLIIAVLPIYSSAMPFPSWTAGVPVFGTALALVFGGVSARYAPARVLSWSPLRAVGDWSYSIYLWHWPLIVAVPVLLGRPAGWKIKLGILLITVVLAVLTKRLVEDRWRSAGARATAWRTFVPMASAMAIFALLTTGAASWQSARTASVANEAAAAMGARSDECLGAGAVVNNCERPYEVTSTVIPAVAANDVPWNLGVAASQRCSGESNLDAPLAHACVFNDPPRPTHTVALIGDSHADDLIDAVNGYAVERGWRLITYTREGCGAIPSPHITDAKCAAWSGAVQKRLRQSKHIDAVVLSNYGSAEQWTVTDGIAALEGLRRSGHLVIPVIDVPGMSIGVSAPACIAAHLADYDPCTSAPPAYGKIAQVAGQLGLPTVSVNDVLCRSGRCHAVIGGQVVYMDEAHFTFHFALTLKSVLGPRIASAIVRESARRG